MSTTIEDVQENLDRMMLTIFEAALKSNAACTDDSSTVVAEAVESGRLINEAYAKTRQSIQCLSGIDRSKDQQLQSIDHLDCKYEEARLRVLQLEIELRRIGRIVDEELNQVC